MNWDLPETINYLVTAFAEERCSVLRTGQSLQVSDSTPLCICFSLNYFHFAVASINLNKGGHKGDFASRFLTSFSR